MCFPQNSSSISSLSSTFSGDQPGPGPHNRLLPLCLLSPSALPLHPRRGWLELPELCFVDLGSNLYSACGCLSYHCPSWDLHCRAFHQPPRGRSYIQVGLEPSFIPQPLLYLPATSSPSGWSRPSPLPHHPDTSQSSPILPDTSRTFEPLQRLLPYPFWGAILPVSPTRGLGTLSTY